jgi:DNA processing protein
MKLEERHFWLGFNVFEGIGPKRFYHLQKTFGSAKKAWQAPKDKLRKTKIPKNILENFFVFRENFDFSKVILRLERCLIRFIIIDDKEYPKNLKKIDAPPPLLYIKGRLLPEDGLSIAVIGTRKMTNYMRRTTEEMVRGLVGAGLTIVSGLARGIDGMAHRVALGNGGRTIAVLGSGLNNIYPPEHRALAEKIYGLDRGAVISEFRPGELPLKGNFPSRNRLISGLSLGVLATGEASSGTKITSRFCLKQKRKLFITPGINSEMGAWAQKGAKLVYKVDDVLEELDKGERER